MGEALPRGPTLTWRTGPHAQRVAWPGGCPKLHLSKPLLPQHLSPWIKSPRGHERVRALGLSACLLQFFLEHLQISVSAPGQPARPLPGPMPVPPPGNHSVGPSHLPLPIAASSTVLSYAVDRGPQGSASVLRAGHSALNLMGSLVLGSRPDAGKGDGDLHLRGVEGVGGRSRSSGQGGDL